MDLWGQSRIDVAVKTAKINAHDLLHEAKSMLRVPKHENIVQILAIICNEEQEVFLVMELCLNGSIKSYINEHRPYFWDCLQNSDYTTILGWALGVAQAMEFCVQKEVMHVIDLDEFILKEINEFSLAE